MKIKTIIVADANYDIAALRFDSKVNEANNTLDGLGAKVKFSQTQHSFSLETGFVLRTTMFYD